MKQLSELQKQQLKECLKDVEPKLWQLSHEAYLLHWLERGADIEEANGTPFKEACLTRNYELINIFIEAEVDVNVADDYDITPLAYVIRPDCEKLVKLLVDAGADVNAGHPHNKPLLLATLSSKNEKIVKILIEARADVNVKDTYEKGMTALIHACYWAQSESIVKMLIEAGADVNAEDDCGNSVLLYAKRSSVGLSYSKWRTKKKIIKMLCEAGAEPTKRLFLSNKPKKK